MTTGELLLHALALVFPAWLLAALLLLSTRVIWMGNRWRLPLLANGAALGLLGSLVLLLALVWTGEDGTILGYALLVMSQASLQCWLLLPSKKS